MSIERHKKLERTGEKIFNGASRLIGAVAVSTIVVAPILYSEKEPIAMPYFPGIIQEEWRPRNIDQTDLPPIYDPVTRLTRDTGMDMQPCFDYDVCGTDIMHPFLMPPDKNGIREVCYLSGDTFAVAGPFLKNLPPGVDKYRAQAILCSDELPSEGKPIVFDRAAGVGGKGTAAEILGGWNMLINDGVSLPDGSIIVSYQHTVEVENPKKHLWYTDRSSLAVSWNRGDNFYLTGPDWENDHDNSDPYQMWSMQLDGDYVYIVSVKTGRQRGPMMLFRSRWDQILNKNAYEYWNGNDWGEKSDAKPILEGHFGEPSLRKLSDGTWVLSYADYTGYPKIVTRTIMNPDQGPEGEWSEPKVHLTAKDFPNLYGGGIHPYSTKDNLVLMISTWQTKGSAERIQDRELVRYDVSHLVTTV